MAEPTIADNLALIRGGIERAAKRAGRDPNSITLIAVSKTVSPERMAQAYACGIRDFGENYMQEALRKFSAESLANLEYQRHFIGHLQSNKARDAIAHFDLIQSVDSFALAKEIGRRAASIGKTASILIEVKLDAAETKRGVLPEATLMLAEQVRDQPNVEVCGLMGMAPYLEQPEASRPYFRLLASIYANLPERERRSLSMGMSNDFEVAIEEGATHLRIGTAIFGKRNMIA